MAFNDDSHKLRLTKMNEMWENLIPLSTFAREQFGIDDIFQDNDGKVMQQLTCLNFLNIEGREGNDGKDENGVEWEMKSINENKTSTISTHHHLNSKIIEKYRKVPWSFAVYHGVELIEIYAMHPEKLNEEYFNRWEKDVVENNRELNNPKISLEFVRKHGELVYNKKSQLIKDPKTIYYEEFMQANLAYDFSTSTTRPIGEIYSELDVMIMGISEKIGKVERDDGVEYSIDGKGFLKIITITNHLKLCIYLGGEVPECEHLSPTRGAEKGDKGKLLYNVKYKLNNKKAPLDVPYEFIQHSFGYVDSQRSVQMSLF